MPDLVFCRTELESGANLMARWCKFTWLLCLASFPTSLCSKPTSFSVIQFVLTKIHGSRSYPFSPLFHFRTLLSTQTEEQRKEIDPLRFLIAVQKYFSQQQNQQPHEAEPLLHYNGRTSCMSCYKNWLHKYSDVLRLVVIEIVMYLILVSPC